MKEGKTIEGVKLYTFEETAKLLDCSKRTVQTYYASKKLKGAKVGRRVYITAVSIANFLKGE